MAVHKSAQKRIRSDEKKRIRNRYQLKTCRTFIKKLKSTSKKDEAGKLLKLTVSLLDKLAKKNIIHINKASNTKSKLNKFVNAM